jgi:hypothetical protein
MERTPNWAAVRVLASTSSLPTFTWPAYCSASSSTNGAMMRQGPHQVAQKSTIERPLLSAISDWKFASVTTVMLSLSAMSCFPFPVSGPPRAR